jgi:hypothetical protein
MQEEIEGEVSKIKLFEVRIKRRAEILHLVTLQLHYLT